MPQSLIATMRREAGLSQAELSRLAGTSRPTLSAYEHGRKSPSLATTQRLLAAAGFGLDVVAQPVFLERPVGHGRVANIPDRLWRLPLAAALRRSAELPLHLRWSGGRRALDLADRRQRQLAYEVVLREGRPSDLLAWVDGALLVDLWPDLVLPSALRSWWQPVVDRLTAPDGCP